MLFCAAAFAQLCLLPASNAAGAAEIEILGPTTIRPVINALGPQFESAAGHKLIIAYDVAPVVKREVEAGRAFDLVIVTRPLLDDLIKEGKVVPETRVDIARAGAGVAVRKGAAKPDISSVNAFRQTLLNAKSIAYAAEGSTGVYFLGLLDRLGIAGEIKPKLRPMGGGGVVAPVATCEAEIAVVTIPLVIEDTRVELVGPVPAELQNYIVFSAGIGAASKQTDAAKALLGFLTAPAAARVIEADGFEPAGH